MIPDQIEQIHTFEQLARALENVDQNTLVLFDVDYTLWVPESNICWYLTKDWHRNKHRYPEWLAPILDAAFKKMSKPELYYKTLWHVKEKPLLINPNIVMVIKALQNKGVPVFALTMIPTGSYGIIDNVPEWRFNKLKEFGINFRDLRFKDIIFTELTKKDDAYPMFYKGILCTAESKGKLLGAFLDRINWKPQHVIFFDDTLSHVENVIQELNNRSISCKGYEYLAAYSMPIELDKKVVELQFNQLIENEVWLSEQEARLILEN